MFRKIHVLTDIREVYSVQPPQLRIGNLSRAIGEGTED